MSAGEFLRTFYQTDKGDIVGISVQPETESLTIGGTANTAPAGPKTPHFPSAQVSKGANTIGINARVVYFRFTDTTPTGYKEKGVLTLPILSNALWDKVERDATGTYNPDGTDHNIKIVGFRTEKVR